MNARVIMMSGRSRADQFFLGMIAVLNTLYLVAVVTRTSIALTFAVLFIVTAAPASCLLQCSCDDGDDDAADDDDAVYVF